MGFLVNHMEGNYQNKRKYKLRSLEYIRVPLHKMCCIQ